MVTVRLGQAILNNIRSASCPEEVDAIVRSHDVTLGSTQVHELYDQLCADNSLADEELLGIGGGMAVELGASTPVNPDEEDAPAGLAQPGMARSTARMSFI